MCLVCCFVGRLHGTACHSASLKQSHTQPCRYMAAGGCTVVTTAPACCPARFTTSCFACPASCDGCFLKTPQLLQHLPHKHSDSIADFYDTLASKRRAAPRPPRDGSTFKFLFVVCTLELRELAVAGGKTWKENAGLLKQKAFSVETSAHSPG